MAGILRHMRVNIVFFFGDIVGADLRVCPFRHAVCSVCHDIYNMRRYIAGQPSLHKGRHAGLPLHTDGDMITYHWDNRIGGVACNAHLQRNATYFTKIAANGRKSWENGEYRRIGAKYRCTRADTQVCPYTRTGI